MLNMLLFVILIYIIFKEFYIFCLYTNQTHTLLIKDKSLIEPFEESWDEQQLIKDAEYAAIAARLIKDSEDAAIAARLIKDAEDAAIATRLIKDAEDAAIATRLIKDAEYAANVIRLIKDVKDVEDANAIRLIKDAEQAAMIEYRAPIGGTIIENTEINNKLDILININKDILVASDVNKKINTDNVDVLNGYYKSLVRELKKHNIITDNDIKLIEKKKTLKILDITEIISIFEKLREDIPDYNIDPNIDVGEYKPIGNGISDNWDYGYSYLNTDRWKVPISKPPLCIRTNVPSVVSGYTNPNYTALKEWDSSRKIFNK